MIDYDYLDKLTEKEKAWLNKFTHEYTNAGKLNKKHKPLHKTPEQKKDCYDRNNARNRCELTRQKASIGIKYLEDYRNTLTINPEDEVNREIDTTMANYHEDYNILKETNEKKVLVRRKKE